MAEHVSALLVGQAAHGVTVGQTLALVSRTVRRVGEAAPVTPLVHTFIGTCTFASQSNNSYPPSTLVYGSVAVQTLAVTTRGLRPVAGDPVYTRPPGGEEPSAPGG